MHFTCKKGPKLTCVSASGKTRPFCGRIYFRAAAVSTPPSGVGCSARYLHLYTARFPLRPIRGLLSMQSTPIGIDFAENAVSACLCHALEHDFFAFKVKKISVVLNDFGFFLSCVKRTCLEPRKAGRVEGIYWLELEFLSCPNWVHAWKGETHINGPSRHALYLFCWTSWRGWHCMFNFSIPGLVVPRQHDCKSLCYSFGQNLEWKMTWQTCIIVSLCFILCLTQPNNMNGATLKSRRNLSLQSALNMEEQPLFWCRFELHASASKLITNWQRVHVPAALRSGLHLHTFWQWHAWQVARWLKLVNWAKIFPKAKRWNTWYRAFKTIIVIIIRKQVTVFPRDLSGAEGKTNWWAAKGKQKAGVIWRATTLLSVRAIHEEKNLEMHLQGVIFRLRFLVWICKWWVYFFVSFSSQQKIDQIAQDAFPSSSTVLIGRRTGWASNSIRASVEFVLMRL